MIAFPIAKINIGLYITGVREDGYHDIETVFYPLNLQDAIEIKVQKEAELVRKTRSTGQRIRRTMDGSLLRGRTDEGVKTEGPVWSMTTYGAPIEGDPADNLVVKAYMMLCQDFELPKIEIRLYKHIPSGAGLGGGSSDAATMIALLNRRFNLRMTRSMMERYAVRLGADCPFFISGTPAYATGIGDVLSPVELSLKGRSLVLVKPDVSVSTRQAYSMVVPRVRDISLKDAVKAPLSEWRTLISNDFEKSVFQLYPEVAAIKERLYDMGAAYVSMSGSGSAVYGIFENVQDDPESCFPGLFCCQRELI